jgi:hypothetical protein
MGVPSPCASRRVGDPEVHAFPCSVRRSVVRRLARSFRVSLPRSIQDDERLIILISSRGNSTMNLWLFTCNESPDVCKSPGLTLYGLACAASWERVPPAQRFLSMLLSPLVFTARSGSALTTFASVMLDFSNKGDECASAHPFSKNVV